MTRIKKDRPEIKKDRETLRPYRLWDAHKQVQLPGRCYRWLENCHDAAVVICRREAKIGRTIEVIDVTRAKLTATYTKKVNGIEIKREKQLRSEERPRFSASDIGQALRNGRGS
jgi:hypothetical protein